MSADIPKTELSKEEKKARKEAKRAAKAAAEAGSGAAAESTESDKKDKKRKRDEKVEGAAAVEAEGGKKEKKDKKKNKDKSDVTAAVEANDGAAATTTSTTDEPALSKKAAKKAAKAAAASASLAPSTISAPGEFTSEHNAYLSTHAITLLPPLYPPHLSIPSLSIPAPLLQYLTKFTTPTPIQACSWPALLAGRDVVGIAETGSGKTLAFGVPALNHLSARLGGSKKGLKMKGNVGVLVLAPTRELAQQSHDNLNLAGKAMGIESTCIFGGVPKDPQTRDLARKEVRIVVGTPGRTLDLANQGDLDLSK